MKFQIRIIQNGITNILGPFERTEEKYAEVNNILDDIIEKTDEDHVLILHQEGTDRVIIPGYVLRKSIVQIEEIN